MFSKTIYVAALAVSALAVPMPDPQTCSGESCVLADLSGSTGEAAPAGASAPSGLSGDTSGLSLPGSTANDLVDGKCLPITVIFARGTTEGGNIGGTVGPSLQSDLQSLMSGQVAFQGVDYSADVAGDIALGRPGGAVATQLLNQANTQCPNTTLFMSGYSEGAMVAHDGVANATAAAKAQTAGVVVFGDPFNGAQIEGYDSSKIKTFCATGDAVCSGEFVISAAHLSYTITDTQQAAQYIQQVAGA